MHDPMTVAFEIKSPFKRKSKLWPEGHRKTLITIWHVDPATDGTDDSCGWFIRQRHGDQKMLEKIIKQFEYDWDTVFHASSGREYFSGYFKPDGDPNFSVHAITLNLFFDAALMMYGRDEAIKWMNKHLVEILLFAENPTDSLYDGFTRKYEKACGEIQTKRQRDYRIRTTAALIYTWILRSNRPWYKHPKWHIRHWKIQWHFWDKFYRWAFERCSICGKRFSKWGDCNVVSDYNGGNRRHGACDGQNEACPRKDC